MRTRARPGDRLVVSSRRTGRNDSHAKILEVLGPDWGPPYLVQWETDGHVELVTPGPEAWVQHFSHLPPRRRAA